MMVSYQIFSGKLFQEQGETLSENWNWIKLYYPKK